MFTLDLRNYVVIVLLGLLVVGGIYSFGRIQLLEAEVATLSASNEKLLVENTTLKSNAKLLTKANKDMEVAVAMQNRAIEDWKRQAEESKARAAKEVEAARKVAAGVQKRYLDIVSRPPADPSKQCESAVVRIDEYLLARVQEASP